MPDLTKTLKDAAYVSVGLGVLAFQKAQVQRRELRQQVTKQLNGTRDQGQKVARLQRRGHEEARQMGGETRRRVVAPHDAEAVAPVELLDERPGGTPSNPPLVGGDGRRVVAAAPAETGEPPVEVDVLPEREAALVPGQPGGIVGGGVLEGDPAVQPRGTGGAEHPRRLAVHLRRRSLTTVAKQARVEDAVAGRVDRAVRPHEQAAGGPHVAGNSERADELAHEVRT